MSLLTNLVPHWKLNEASGNALDANGTNTATDNNTVTAAAGKINEARSFDSANLEEFSVAGTTFKVTSGDFAVSAWVYPTAVATGAPYGRGIACHMSGGNGSLGDWFLSVTDTGRVRLGYHAAADGVSDLTGMDQTVAGVIVNNTWYHVFACRRSGVSEIWLNGVRQTLSNGVFDTGWANSGFRIGRNSYAIAEYCWHGLIDEMSIWIGRAPSGAEVLDLYNAGSGLPYEGFAHGADAWNAAKAIWEYPTRTLVSGTPDAPAAEVDYIAGEIWTYTDRTAEAAPAVGRRVARAEVISAGVLSI